MKKINVSREDILKAGLQLISSGTNRTLTLRDLSNKTGVSVGTLYNYFGDKEQLQREVLGYFWKATMHQESLLNCDSIDFISHIEQSYSLFFSNFLKINGAINKNTLSAINKCDMQVHFPITHISEKLEVWVKRLIEFHNDELKPVEMKCTQAELINYIVAAYIGNFLRGNDNLGIAMEVLRAYL